MACDFEQCGWIWIQTSKAESKDFSVRGTTLKDMEVHSDDFVRRALATIEVQAPSGIERRTDPSKKPCADECLCRQSKTIKEDDWGPWFDLPVEVKVPLKGEQGSPSVSVKGNVKQRIVEVPGRCMDDPGKKKKVMFFTFYSEDPAVQIFAESYEALAELRDKIDQAIDDPPNEASPPSVDSSDG